MGPQSATKTIPEFCINWVKHQLSQGKLVTRNQMKNALKSHFENCPWLYGTNKDGNTPSWGSVAGTFRSMYAAMKNGSGGAKALVGYLYVVSNEGVDYVFDTEHTYEKAQIGMSFREVHYGQEIKIIDQHTESQFRLCSIAEAAGYKVYVPHSNRNKKTSNGMTVSQVFDSVLVDDFKGYSSITKEIDVIFLDELDGNLIPVRSYEVENSTGAVTGISRMLALDCPGVVVDTKNQYKDKFNMYVNESFSNSKDSLIYRKGSEVFKFSESIDEYEEAFDMTEIRNLIPKKV